MSTGLHCQAHPGEHFTNFCTALQCLHPLCPECIDDHINFHKSEQSHSEVASILTVRKGCEKKIQTAQNILMEKLRLPQVIALTDPDYFYNTLVQLIQNYKFQVLNIENQYILDKLKNKYPNENEDQFNILEDCKNSFFQIRLKKQVIGNINSVLQQLHSFQESYNAFGVYKKNDAHEKSEEQLDTEDQALENLRKVCQLDVKSLIDRLTADLKKEMRGCQTNSYFCLDTSTIGLNEQAFNQFQTTLESLIQITNKFDPQQFQQVQEEYKSRTPSPEQNFHTDQKDVQSASFKRYSEPSDIDYASKFRQINISPINQQKYQKNVYPNQTLQMSTHQDLLLQMPTFFKNNTKRKIMQFFKQNDQILYELDLNKEQLAFTQIDLNLHFQLPAFFSSVVSPHGDIYLLGGSIHQNAQQKSPDIFCYEHINRTLLKYGTMLTPRSSFGCCFIYPYIYSFCGISEEGMTLDTERFHVLNQQSESLANSLHAGISPGVVSFNNGKQIWKYGGNSIDTGQQSHQIEKYIVDENKWLEVEIVSTQNVLFQQFCAGSQINEGEMIVFGGYDKDNIGYNSTYLIKPKGQQLVEIKETWQLPSGEGFWTAQVIWKDNKLYVLQNIELEGTHDIDESKRSLLMLSAKGWVQLK